MMFYAWLVQLPIGYIRQPGFSCLRTHGSVCSLPGNRGSCARVCQWQVASCCFLGQTVLYSDITSSTSRCYGILYEIMLSADNATAWQLFKEIFLLSKRKNWETAAKHNFFLVKKVLKSIFFETPVKGFLWWSSA